MKKHGAHSLFAAFILSLFSLGLLFSSCDKDGNWVGFDGETITKTMDLDDFNAIALYDNIDIELRKAAPGENARIELTGGKHLIDKIDTDIEDFSDGGLNDFRKVIGKSVYLEGEIGGTNTIAKVYMMMEFEFSNIKGNYKRLNIRNKHTLSDYQKKKVKAIVYYKNPIEHIEYRSIGDITCSEPIALTKNLLAFDYDGPTHTQTTFDINIDVDEAIIDSIISAAKQEAIDSWPNYSRFMLQVKEGAGDLFLDLETNEFNQTYIKYHYGSAEIVLRGKGEKLFFSQMTECFGFIDTRDFYANLAECDNYSNRDCHIRAAESLTVGIFGAGNVYYYGNPEFGDPKGNGSGKLIPAGN